MNNELTFRILLLLMFAGFIIHRAYYTRKSSPSDESVEIDRENSFILQLIEFLSLFALIATVVYIINPAWMAWASLPLPVFLRWGGLGIGLIGFALLQWSQITLGKNWSDTPVLLKEHHLVTEGPYQWVRHPIYTAFLLILSSYALISSNWFIGLFWLGTSSADILMRMRYEEQLMLNRFGDEYSTYMQHTGRLLPRF